jgi:hypothetical protein
MSCEGGIQPLDDGIVWYRVEENAINMILDQLLHSLIKANHGAFAVDHSGRPS